MKSTTPKIWLSLINKLWQFSWPNTRVKHVLVLGSNHCPLIIQRDSQPGVGRPLFRFQAFWAKEDVCQWLVKNLLVSAL